MMFGDVPRISGENVSECYQTVDLRDDWLGTGPSNTIKGNLIGKARVLQLEKDGNKYNCFLFDIQMFTALNFASSQSIIDGELLVGRSSGARGYVYSPLLTMQWFTRYLVSSSKVKLSSVTEEFLMY